MEMNIVEKEVSYRELESILKKVNEKSDFNKAKKEEQERLQEERIRKIKFYKHKAQKRRKKLIKRVMIGTLIATLSVAAAQKVHTIVTDADVLYYEVEPGDSLSLIANKFHTPIEKIYRYNGSVIGVNGVINPGDVLVLTTNPKIVDKYEETHDMEENKEEYYERKR